MSLFHQDTLHFLELLSLQNSTERFHAHKDRYDEIRKEFKDALQQIIVGISHFDHQLQEVTASQSMFRIHRDTRFRKDKSPYKTNFGASLSQGGKKSSYASYYVHLEPGNHSFLGGGVYRPDPSVTKKIRETCLVDGKTYTSILSKKSFKEIFEELQGRQVKTYPRGYGNYKDHHAIDLIRMKDWYVIYPLQDKDILDPKIYEKIIPVFQELTPFIHFLNKAIEQN